MTLVDAFLEKTIKEFLTGAPYMDRYTEFVFKEARRQGVVYLIDTGETRAIDYKGMLVEDLSGWLFTIEELEEFLQASDTQEFSELKETQFFDEHYAGCDWFIENDTLGLKFYNCYIPE